MAASGSHQAVYNEVAAVWDASAKLAGRPAMQALADDAYRRGGRGRFRPARWGARPLAALATAAVAIVAVILFSRYPMGDSYITRVGQQSVVTLEDGSRIALDTDTDLRVRFSAGARHVEFKHGEAYFTVAHMRSPK